MSYKIFQLIILMDDFEACTLSLGLDFKLQHRSFTLGFDDDEGEYEKLATSNQDH